MGAEYFDYLIADPTIIPQDYQQYYSEKIVYLPSYQVNDNKREVSKKLFTREELGLPADGFVFCCFNNSYKITPTTFDSWMRILNAVEGSTLLLLDANETATRNINKEAEARGGSANRLVFAKHLPLPEYLARYRTADLFLDTLPYNAGTTASDALRMGLPVLTLMGESFASRVAASLLNAVGLPELITTSQEAYESLAIQLATDPDQLEKIKNKLVNNLPNSPLYNTKLFTQHLESAYQTMYQRYQDDLAPDHIKLNTI
jgi:predicted O-linked N-acetylglucosamine transferase (SPINDLY family)